jgi:long-chain fatty acid transport protein
VRLAHTALAAALVLCAQTATAGNGTNLIGFGVESWLLAGADVAAARDTSALSTNPAGITQLNGSAFDGHAGVATTSGTRHRDQFGNDVEADNEILALGDFGYVRAAPGSRFAWGIGMFAQGGAGNVYKHMNTAFGTNDELSALFRVAKINPGFAYRATDKLSLGVTVPIVYADFKQKFFPDTSAPALPPAPPFFGSEIKDTRALNAGAKVGAMYRATDRLTLALTLSNAVDLKLKDGSLTMNYDALGLGRVRYRDARVEGLHLPQEIAVGAGQRIGDRWLLSLKLSRLDWSRAFRSLRIRARSPENPLAPAAVDVTAPVNWRDQTVVALGVAYEATPKTTLLAGLNYGRTPVTPETMTPLLAAVGEKHATFGVIHKLNQNWQASGGVEIDFANTVTYTNPNQPFGANTQERGKIVGVHFGIGRRW